MGQYVFKLPDVGEGIAEAEIVAWHVKPGERVEEDQPLVDVMTDKANVEITSPVSGQVVALHGEVGLPAAIGSAIAVFEVQGAGNVDPAMPAPPAAAVSEPQAPPAKPAEP
ncbi:MAG TPA: biotin/lipoyl-containing protein, partial [Caulobacter sp.]|nr:biotin/lipoyl-containing protein [Caulobacter sp.]